MAIFIRTVITSTFNGSSISLVVAPAAQSIRALDVVRPCTGCNSLRLHRTVMADLGMIVADIDSRVEYISVQVDSMGADRTDLVTEQYTALLSSFSMFRNVNMNMINRICEHLAAKDVFAREQLTALSACLRAALSAAAREKPSIRKMQHNDSFQHYLTDDDWSRLTELGKQKQPNTNLMEEIVASRMHNLGIGCADVDIFKRASAIIQSSMLCVTATHTDARDYVCGVRDKLKKFDKGSTWPFEYITTYPRSPIELPPHIFTHAYGTDKPISMPDTIKNTTFRLKVAGTRYNKPRLQQTEPSVAIVPHVPLSPTPEPHTMNAGPFAAVMNLIMQQMPHVGSQNTEIRFNRRIPHNLGTTETKR